MKEATQALISALGITRPVHVTRADPIHRQELQGEHPGPLSRHGSLLEGHRRGPCL